MPLSPVRAHLPFVLSVALGLAACSSPAPETLTCETEAECPSGTRCLSGGCVANSPPAASVALPAGELQANLLLSFDGSASADADPGDGVASFGWTFRALDGQCAPPVVAGTGAIATVRFACPGRWAVDLAAVDEMGAEGTRTVEFVVAAYAGPPLVVTAADVSVDHACTTAPLRCAPAGTVSLGATAPGFAPEDVTLSWTVEPPPDRPLDATRRVTLAPGPDVPSPAAVIETDGTAISGDWVFLVEARDAAGVLGTAAMRVSVGNRPPVVTGTLPAQVNHAYAAGTFTAGGEIAVGVVDPDGDLLVQRSAQWRHSGDGPGAIFEGSDLSDRLTFSIAVPYGAPADALHLIGGDGLERSVELAISDVNGARTAASFAVVVANRPPVVVSTPAPFTVDHSYDPSRLAYVATASLSRFSDPDGDPLFPVAGAPSSDPLCAVLLPPGGVAVAECSLAFFGVPAVGNFAGTHVVTQHVQDPWLAAAPATATFTIGNRAPAVTSTAAHYASSACLLVGCCHFVAGEGCLTDRVDFAESSTLVPSRWADADGDPLTVRVASSAIVCTTPGCSLQLDLSAEVGVCAETTDELLLTITDGGASTSGTFPLVRHCG